MSCNSVPMPLLGTYLFCFIIFHIFNKYWLSVMMVNLGSCYWLCSDVALRKITQIFTYTVQWELILKPIRLGGFLHLLFLAWCRRWYNHIFRSWWCHDMETIFALMALCEGNPPVIDGFPSQRASDAGLWSLHLCRPEQIAEQTVDGQVNWNVLTLIWHYCNGMVFRIPFEDHRRRYSKEI